MQEMRGIYNNTIWQLHWQGPCVSTKKQSQILVVQTRVTVLTVLLCICAMATRARTQARTRAATYTHKTVFDSLVQQ